MVGIPRRRMPGRPAREPDGAHHEGRLGCRRFRPTAMTSRRDGDGEPRTGNPSSRFSEDLRRVLETELLKGPCTSIEIARLFSMHHRTLSRHLAREGVTFQQLVDEIRFTIARDLLANTELALNQISVMLRYPSRAPSRGPSTAGPGSLLGLEGAPCPGLEAPQEANGPSAPLNGGSPCSFRSSWGRQRFQKGSQRAGATSESAWMFQTSCRAGSRWHHHQVSPIWRRPSVPSRPCSPQGSMCRNPIAPRASL